MRHTATRSTISSRARRVAFKFGLERTRRAARRISAIRTRTCPSFHVAGTNGKGSSVATLDALLAREGTARRRRTRRRTSSTFASASSSTATPIPARRRRRVRRQADAGRSSEIGASFFEATTAMAFDYFARAGADVAVIETGLGGRLDSTNVRRPDRRRRDVDRPRSHRVSRRHARGDRGREGGHLQAWSCRR